MATDAIINLFDRGAAPPAHDADAAVAALEIIFGNRPRQVVGLAPDGREFSATFDRHDEAGFRAWLTGSAAGSNVYFAHAERRPGALSRKKADLIAAHWLHVDLDPGHGLDVEAERTRMRALLALPPEGVPPPSLIVDSGRGYQALWHLEEPSTDLAEVEACNRWLIAELGGDGPVFDVSRILRLPGTVNFKPAAEGRLASVVSHKGSRCALGDFGSIGHAARAQTDLSPVVELDTAQAIVAAREFLASAAVAVEGLGGRTKAFEVGARLKRMGLSVLQAQDLAVEIYDPRCVPADADWMRERIASGWIDGAGRPGCDHPDAQYAGVLIDQPDEAALSRRPVGIRWADDAASDQPIQWLLKGILPRTGVGIIYGAPKSGKSFVAFDLAARLACHLTWFDVRTPKEPVGTLMLLGEGGGTVTTRLQAFAQATGRTVGPLAWLTVSNLASAAGVQAARSEIQKAADGMSARGTRLALIIVDTLASALGLEDENSAPEVTKALKILEALATEFDLAILGIHHAGKNGQDRGSSAFRAACDVMMAVERGEFVAGQPEHRQLSVVLNRNGEGDWSTNFRLDRVVLGQDEDGDDITSCAVRPAGAGPVTLGRRETVMAMFDPATVHLYGRRLPGDSWAITKSDVRDHCYSVWGEELSKDSRRKTLSRTLAELLTAGRLLTLHDGGVECLALGPTKGFEGVILPDPGGENAPERDKGRDKAGHAVGDWAKTQ